MTHSNTKVDAAARAQRKCGSAARWLSCALLAASTPVMAQDGGSGSGNRAPQLHLVEYGGTLCPVGSADLSASSDGGLTWKPSVDPVTSTEDAFGDCRIEIDVIVPANARFRNPHFCPSIYAWMEPDALQSASQLSFTYTLRDGGPLGPIVGRETQPETIEPQRYLGIDGDYDETFCKLVNMTSPECVDPTQESVFRLSIELSTRAKPGTYVQLSALDAEFNEGLGANWGTCDGFEP